jgi:hypothetical protein
MRVLKVATLVVASGWFGASAADPCPGPSGFADVAQSDIFCTNVQWLANRSITTGCDRELYCPDDPVTRAQMALFMNRLARAMLPAFVTRIRSGTPIDLGAPSIQCETPDIAGAPYERIAIGNATMSALADASLTMRADLAYSLDGGTSWSLFFSNTSVNRGSIPANQWGNLSHADAVVIEPGEMARFGIQVVRDGAGAGNLDNFRCFLMIQYQNRNPASPPFDHGVGLSPQSGRQ